jgi:(S)-2-hydroxyglutarate dehydrogenase
VPDPSFPFLGAHFARLIHGGLEAGPNAVLALKREVYCWTDFSMRDASETLVSPSLWRFRLRYSKASVKELAGSLSRGVFLKNLMRLVPEITAGDLQAGRAGVRA